MQYNLFCTERENIKSGD